MVRLKKCFWCIKLRRGCIAIACIDITIDLLIIILSPVNLLSQAERAVAICHLIGCFMLLLGAIIESTVLLLFYLITSVVNAIILIACFIIVSIFLLSLRILVLVVGIILLILNAYFYVVAFSYYYQVNKTFEQPPEEMI